MMVFTTMLVLSRVFSLFSVPYLNTLAMRTTNQLTAHVEKLPTKMVRAPPSNHGCSECPDFKG